MFDIDDDSNTKRIMMRMTGPKGESVEVTMNYDIDTAWPEIAGQFHQFLSGMGYIVKPETVGAEY